MRGIGHVQHLRSRDGHSRPTVHVHCPPCVRELAGVMRYGAARYVCELWPLSVAGHKATLLAARSVRTLSAAHL